MRWSRFLLGVATGAIATYLLTQNNKKETFVKPEHVIQSLKQRYKDSMSIIGSWIHVEPKLEEINGIDYYTYEAGLTGLINNDEPTFLEFKVDAKTGSLLQVNE